MSVVDTAKWALSLSFRDEYCFLGQPITNNVAEYEGLIRGLTAASEGGITNLVIYGDSKLVIEQMKVTNSKGCFLMKGNLFQGTWRVKSSNLTSISRQVANSIALLLQCSWVLKARILANTFIGIDYNHVERDQNGKTWITQAAQTSLCFTVEADELANRAINTQDSRSKWYY